MHIQRSPFVLAPILLMIALVPASAPAQNEPSSRPTSNPIESPQRVLTASIQTGPSGIILSYAGNGFLGESGNGGPATKAELILPSAVATDSIGNVYIADSFGEVIHKVNAVTGIITTYAGSGAGGYSGDNGKATSARLNRPLHVAVDSADNIYISDYLNNVIRKVNGKTGIITTVAGNGYGAGSEASQNVCGVRADSVLATKSPLCRPIGLTIAPNGDLYIADSGYDVIRKVTFSTGILTTIAGNGSTGYSGDGGLAINAKLNSPGPPALDGTGNIYFPDAFNCAVRKVTVATGIITSFIGKPAPNNGYGGVCGLSGDGGPASVAKISAPEALAFDSAGNLFIADTSNYLVRMVYKSSGKIYTVAGSYTSSTDFSGTRYYGAYGSSGDGGPAAHAKLSYPEGVTVDSSGSLFIADTNNCLIRKVSYASAPPAETPVIYPAGGSFSGPVTVKILAPAANSTIYYTTDGSIPTTSSTQYTGPITGVKTELITAFAVVPGAMNSDAAVGNFFYAPRPTITPGVKNSMSLTPITIKDANPSAQIYYTIDGSDPTLATSQAILYAAPFSVSGSVTVKAAAWVFTTNYAGIKVGGWSAVAGPVYTTVQ